MSSCFIIGNGPSFNNIPAGLLESVPTFGMNYCGFQPTYYVCIDSEVLTHHAEEIRPFVEGAEMAFLSELLKGINSLYDLPNIVMVGKGQNVFRDEQYMSGFTATYVALKAAYYLGFDEVHLYGVDHSPAWEHYREDYPAGKKTERPRLMEVMEWHYRLAAKVYAHAGRAIINHSNPSKLDEIFTRA